MKEKIIKHYSEKFQIPIDEGDIQTLIKNGCKCGLCGESVFELDDFPEIKEGLIFCESCYDENHSDVCGICENSFDIWDGNKYGFVLIGSNEDAGIYEGDECVLKINLEEYEGKKMMNIEGHVCPDCVEKFLKTKLSEHMPRYTVFYEKWAKEYRKKELHGIRMKLINEDINKKGVIETARKKQII